MVSLIVDLEWLIMTNDVLPFQNSPNQMLLLTSHPGHILASPSQVPPGQLVGKFGQIRLVGVALGPLLNTSGVSTRQR